jgi:OmpA-OmpF porin, OOP family
VLFESDSFTLTPESLPILNLGVVLMKQNPKITIDVIGHTDSEGSLQSNAVLAQRRCDAVIAYLTAAGIEPERLLAVPKGSTEPVADNANPEGRRLNRRAEFIVHGLLET